MTAPDPWTAGREALRVGAQPVDGSDGHTRQPVDDRVHFENDAHALHTSAVDIDDPWSCDYQARIALAKSLLGWIDARNWHQQCQRVLRALDGASIEELAKETTTR